MLSKIKISWYCNRLPLFRLFSSIPKSFMMPPQSLLTERFMEFNFIELLGYLATFFVAASFLFKSIVHLRVVNAIGAVLFVVYSLIIKSYPVALLNAFLVFVNLYQLYRLKKSSRHQKCLNNWPHFSTIYPHIWYKAITSGIVNIQSSVVTP